MTETGRLSNKGTHPSFEFVILVSGVYLLFGICCLEFSDWSGRIQLGTFLIPVGN